MSFIKGSIEALEVPTGRLTMQAYKSLSKKCQLDERKRELVYKLFERYEQMKRELGDYDIGDYVFHAIQQVQPYYCCALTQQIAAAVIPVKLAGYAICLC